MAHLQHNLYLIKQIFLLSLEVVVAQDNLVEGVVQVVIEKYQTIQYQQAVFP